MSTSKIRLLGQFLSVGLFLVLSVAAFAQSDNTQISGFVKDQVAVLGPAVKGAGVKL